MEDNKKPSSLPANYVTLVQLQERWLKEKERKLKEKEQQDKQKERQQKQQQKQKRKLQAQNAVARRSQPDSKSPVLCRLEWNQRDKPEASVSEVEVAGHNKNVDQEGKSVNSKKKKKKKKKKYPKKENPNPAVEDDVTEKDGVVHKPLASEEKEDMPGTRNKESRGMKGKFRAKKSSNLNQTKVEIETGFRDSSVNASNGNGCNETKRTSTYNDRGNREVRGYGTGKSYGRQVRKPRDAGLIWVKKGELFNGNVGSMQTLVGSHSVSGEYP